MKNIIFLCFFSLSINGYAQTLKGNVTDTKGKPIEYVSIYVHETKRGSTTSELGEFILTLKPGKYTCTFQHLSFKSVTKTVQIPQESFLEIKMEPKAVLLREVKVNSKEEDKAYRIIRNVVAKSHYYQKQLLSYKATFYAKGSLKVKDVPKLMNFVNKQIKEEENKIPIKKNDIYTEESVSEVVVTPDKTEQKVISKRSSYPEELGIGGADRFGYYNIYRSNDEFISPVTKQGLSAYRYHLEYSYRDGEFLIHRIEVIPRNKSPYAFSGYIDIIDGSWHVYNFDLKGNINVSILKVAFSFKQNYVPIEKNVWMPGSFHTSFDVKAMGFHFDMNTAYSIRYKDYKVNPVLSFPNPPDEVLTSTPEKKPVVSKKSEKLTQQITEITEKEELTTRDVIKLVDLMESKSKEDSKNNSQNDSINSLEIRSRFFLTIDSNASKYDSSIWETYRTIPLSEEEVIGFEQKKVNDSIKEEKKKMSLLNDIEIDKKKENKTFFIGVSFMKSMLAFNTVEGFKAGIHLYANKRFKDTVTSLNNGITFGYAFTSKHFFFNASSQWNYNPRRFADLELFGGKQTADFKHEQQNGKYFLNSFSSLFFRNNLIQYYDRTFVGLRHKIEAFNGFQTSVGLSYEHQYPLENRSDYSFFFRKIRQYKPNIPDNEYVANNSAYISSRNSFLMDISFSYTPKMHYRYSRNKKVKYYAGSKYPTFTVSWKKGINGLLGSTSNFDYLELNIAQDVDLKLLKSFKYSLSAGFFPNAKSLHFSNFAHFHGNNFWIAFNPLYGAFNTMSNYKYSTNEWFISGHTKFETPYLVLKYIPGLNKTLITENLHLSFLTNPLTKSYIEIGYSLSKIYLTGNVGFFIGFDEFKFSNWSIRAGISLF